MYLLKGVILMVLVPSQRTAIKEMVRVSSLDAEL